jgi:hypothetical protein
MMRGKKKEGQGEEENTRFQQVQPSPLEHLVSHKLRLPSSMYQTKFTSSLQERNEQRI